MIAVYVFGGIMVVLIAAVIIAPLIEDRDAGKAGAEDSPAARKDEALAALRELEFEYETGKVSEEDYSALRARYARAALAARDELGEQVPADACPACGSGVRGDAKFCSRCGTVLHGEDGA